MMSEGVENDRKTIQVINVRMRRTTEREPAVSKKIRSKYDIFMVYLVLM